MNETQLQLVTNAQAKKLYHLGFIWEVNHYYPTVGDDWDIIHDLHQTLNVNQLYENKIAAPTVALALKWFRDVKKIIGEIGTYKYENRDIYYYFYGISAPTFKKPVDENASYKNYEAAESALLDKLLTITENQNL